MKQNYNQLRKRLSSLVMVLVLLSGTVWAQMKADYGKLSPMLVHNLMQYENNVKKLAPGGAQPRKTAIVSFVKLGEGENEATLKEHGCVPLTEMGGVYIALVPVDRLPEMTTDPAVTCVEAGPCSKPLMDITLGKVNVLPIYSGMQLPQAFTGKGVVAGLADTGFDLTHPNFLDAQGNTRIKAMLDIFTGGKDYCGIGTVYDTPAEIKAKQYTSDAIYGTHGTHVLGIEAGSGGADGYLHGVAYEADIVAANANLGGIGQELIDNLNASLNNISPDEMDEFMKEYELIGSNVMDLVSIKFVFDQAEKLGQPCVVNCSYGARQDFYSHTGTSLDEQAYSSLVGEGRIIVAAVGNDGDSKIYERVEKNQKKKMQAFFSSKNVTFSARAAGDFKMYICSDNVPGDTLWLNTEDMDGEDEYRMSAKWGDDEIDASVYVVADNSGKTGLMYFSVILPESEELRPYAGKFLTLGLITGGVDVEILGIPGVLTFNRMPDAGVNEPYTAMSPAIFNDVIAVGLTSYRNKYQSLTGEGPDYGNLNAEGDVVSWSSCGPGVNGLTKPDVMAPGYNIWSSLNSYSQENNDRYKVYKYNYGGKDYYWMGMSGTSQASPVVSGVVALWLQANPKLTPEDIKAVIKATSRSMKGGGEVPDNKYGYGEIDAYKGLLYILTATGIDGVSDHQPAAATFSLAGRTLTVNFGAGNEAAAANATVSVYATDGRLLKTQPLVNGTADMGNLQSGVYAVQLNTGDKQTTGSTLIRL